MDTYCCEKMPLNIIIMIMLYLALAHPINAACAPVHNKKKGGVAQRSLCVTWSICG